MPVSSPSYFGPQRSVDRIVGLNAGLRQTGNRVFLAGLNAGTDSTVADLIVIGSSSGGATTGFTDAGLRGSTIVGSQSLPVNVDATSDILGQGGVGAITIVGWNNYPAIVAGSRIAGSILIGANIATSMPAAAANANFARNILIGNSIWNNNTAPNGFGSSDNVIIGYTAANRGAVAGNSQWLHNVVIGSQAAAYAGASASDNVIIGYLACNGMSSTPAQNVIIGAAAGTLLAAPSFAPNNVLIGYATNLTAPGNGQNTIVGAQSTVVSGDRNTILGAVSTWIGSGSGNISIGARDTTGSTIPVSPSDRIVIEVNGKTFLYGNLAGGNFLIGGQPSTGAQRTIIDTPNGAVNTLGLVNGVKSGTNPTNGGYFYVVAGVLHWVDAAGVDSTLSLGAGGQLASSATAYTNNAAAAAGTLTNAPAAGNPTKWIPVNDNGTIRNIPAW